MAPYMDDMTSSEQASRLQSAPGPAAGGDELDDLFDYDAAVDDPFRPLSPPKHAQKDGSKKNHAATGLGIDKEIEITRKPREPRAKLDETRLLSKAGILKLRKRAKDLKLKGKGHEYSDAARLLSMYQLWLDDLFPKARFLDALAMVEKEGHKKRMQIQRMAWINEGRPKPPPEESLFDGQMADDRESGQTESNPRVPSIFEKSRDTRHATPTVDEGIPEDVYNATPRPANPAATSQTYSQAQNGSIFGPPKPPATAEEPDDDLDALLAEAEMENESSKKGSTESARPTAAPEPDFDDEMEAMAGMDDLW